MLGLAAQFRFDDVIAHMRGDAVAEDRQVKQPFQAGTDGIHCRSAWVRGGERTCPLGRWHGVPQGLPTARREVTQGPLELLPVEAEVLDPQPSNAADAVLVLDLVVRQHGIPCLRADPYGRRAPALVPA